MRAASLSVAFSIAFFAVSLLADDTAGAGSTASNAAPAPPTRSAATTQPMPPPRRSDRGVDAGAVDGDTIGIGSLSRRATLKNASNALCTSFIDWKRCSGSFASNFSRISSSRPGGRSGRCVGGTGSVTILCRSLSVSVSRRWVV